MNSEIDLFTDRTVKQFKAAKNDYLSQRSDEVDKPKNDKSRVNVNSILS